ncbi:MAG: hypothetical protein SPK00_03300 [Corynebacterium glucuronolyticum]|nr:hypothetical protein [Mycobacteriaceae bacterium]MDY5833763.1 hypothetical protein [Corynebacterium glucuronolyticum]
MVRLYPQPELRRLGIAAANLHSVFISWIDLEMMTDSTRDIEVAEISAQEAKALKAFPILAVDDEVPMAGIHIMDDRVELTDETGLGIGIRKVSVRRQTPKPVLVDIFHATDVAMAEDYEDWLPLHKEQAAILAKVLSALKAPAVLAFKYLEPGVSKMRATGENFLLTIQAGKVKQNAEQPATPEHQTASQKPILEVARPAGGIA